MKREKELEDIALLLQARQAISSFISFYSFSLLVLIDRLRDEKRKGVGGHGPAVTVSTP